jgi:hypothetical protein
MKLTAYISPVLYKQYCKVNWLDNTEDSLRRFLREFGTHSVTFQDVSGEDYKVVPPGTCIRLFTSEKYAVVSTRYLNLYSTVFTKHDEVRLEPNVPVGTAPKSSWFRLPWCV